MQTEQASFRMSEKPKAFKIKVEDKVLYGKSLAINICLHALGPVHSNAAGLFCKRMPGTELEGEGGKQKRGR